MNIAVYTAVAGAYTNIKPVCPQTVPGVEWFAFTEGLEREAGDAGWQHVPLAHKDLIPRRRAKWYKMHPHLALPWHEVTIWIDGSIQVTSPMFVGRILEGMLKNLSSIAMYEHPDWDDIESEADFAAQMPKYAGQRLREQAAWYRNHGLPHRYGVWCGGVIARYNYSQYVRDMMDVWWAEMDRSLEDQISFPYASWKVGHKPSTITAGTLTDNPYFTYQCRSDR